MSVHTTQILDFIRSRYPQAEIGPDDDFFAVGYINSLFAMELVMFVEKTYDVRIPNNELRIDNFRSASGIARLVERLGSTDNLVQA